MAVTLVGAPGHDEPPSPAATGVRKIFGRRRGDQRAQAADVLLDEVLLDDVEDDDVDPEDFVVELLPESELLLSALVAGLLLDDEPRLSVR
jgi:hypothetical protein